MKRMSRTFIVAVALAAAARLGAQESNDSSSAAPTPQPPSSASRSASTHEASRTPRGLATKEMTETAPSASSDQSAAPAAAATGATAASDSSTNPPPPPPASGEISSANSAVPTVPIADRPVQESAETRARHGITAGAWLLIGGLVLAIVGIASMLRRRGREESISIVDHSTPPRTGPSGTTMAHHP